MRVLLKKDIDNASGHFAAGLQDLPDETAIPLVFAGLAEEVKPSPKKAKEA